MSELIVYKDGKEIVLDSYVLISDWDCTGCFFDDKNSKYGCHFESSDTNFECHCCRQDIIYKEKVE